MGESKLPENWAREWESTDSMAFFLMEELRKGEILKVYVLNKDSLKFYRVVNAPFSSAECYFPSFVFHRGKLYVVAERNPDDVYVCDLLSPPPYVWTRGPPMRSTKHQPHLVAYDGLIFALSTPQFYSNLDPVDPIATFEVWDTRLNVPCWEVLPDPPLKDYNNRRSLYELFSHAILDGLLYFVFDYTDLPYSVSDKDSGRLRPSSVCTKVLAFDPKLRRWASSSDDTKMVNVSEDDDDDDEDEDEDVNMEDDEDAYDMLSLYIDLSARRHERGVNVVEFFKGDPSLRMFLLDPAGVNAMPPCFYSYDRSTFDRKTLVSAVREFWPPRMSGINSGQYLNWFQAFVRPYLPSVTGLKRLMEILMWQAERGSNCFVLPCSYDRSCWTFCIVAFIKESSADYCTLNAVAKFRLSLQINNSFHAEDFEMRLDYLPDTAKLPHTFYRIP